MFFIISLFFYSFSFANLSCLQVLNSQVSFNNPIPSFRTFHKVEVLRKNNAIGIQQKGDLELTRWLELDFTADEMQSVIGINEEGQVFHIAHLGPHRTVAKLLSGNQRFTDFFVSSRGDLFALKKDQSLFIYRSSLWNAPARKSILKKTGAYWLAGTLASLVAVNAATADSLSSFFQNLQNFEAYEAMAPILSALSTFFVGLRSYETLNTFPDGFQKLKLSETQARQLTERQLQKLNPERNDFRIPSEQEIGPSVPDEATEEIHR